MSRNRALPAVLLGALMLATCSRPTGSNSPNDEVGEAPLRPGAFDVAGSWVTGYIAGSAFEIVVITREPEDPEWDYSLLFRYTTDVRRADEPYGTYIFIGATHDGPSILRLTEPHPHVHFSELHLVRRGTEELLMPMPNPGTIRRNGEESTTLFHRYDWSEVLVWRRPR